MTASAFARNISNRNFLLSVKGSTLTDIVLLSAIKIKKEARLDEKKYISFNEDLDERHNEMKPETKNGYHAINLCRMDIDLLSALNESKIHLYYTGLTKVLSKQLHQAKYWTVFFIKPFTQLFVNIFLLVNFNRKRNVVYRMLRWNWCGHFLRARKLRKVSLDKVWSRSAEIPEEKKKLIIFLRIPYEPFSHITFYTRLWISQKKLHNLGPCIVCLCIPFEFKYQWTEMKVICWAQINVDRIICSVIIDELSFPVDRLPVLQNEFCAIKLEIIIIIFLTKINESSHIYYFFN